MAIVGSGNVVVNGLQGKLGNVIFRKRGNKTSVYVMSPRTGTVSEKQKIAQQQFALAVSQAKVAIANKEEREKFEQLARKTGKESAYSAAVAYFMEQAK